MKVAILGTVPYTRILAPFKDPEWRIWACSPGNGYGILERVDIWFELHGVVDLKGVENADWNDRYFTWLRSQTFPVYMQEPNDLVPQAAIFPIKAILDSFGEDRDIARIAFSSSIAEMIGYAMFQGAQEIAVYGVDMAATEEAYSGQKHGCLTMMALAKKRGIKVSVPLESSLAVLPPLYGYAEASRMGRVLLAKELQASTILGQVDAQIKGLHDERQFIAGALEQIRFLRRTFVDGENLDATELDTLDAAAKRVDSHGEDAAMAVRADRAFGTFRMTPGHVLVPRAPNGDGSHISEK